MDGKWYIVVSVWCAWVFAFTFHDDLIPMTFNGETLDKPFLGGFNRPKIQWVDWDYDNDIDLFILDASGYLRYLENEGSADTPDFHLLTTSFRDLYCGGWFYFADYDEDGDRDIMTQNDENPDHISYFKNIQEASFDFMGVLPAVNGGYVTSSSVMTPTFADIDNDGDLDFFTGNMTGTLTHYENTGLEGGIPQFEFITNSWQDIYIVGGARTDDRHGASAITFIDLDGDSDLDLSWGDYFQQSLYIIWNTGSAEYPNMNEITTQYPPDNPIISTGQNMPTFADLDGDGDEDLYVTVLSGAYGNQLVNNFFYYENTGSNAEPTYNYETNNYFSTLDIFSNTSPELVDIDLDGDLDLFIANQYDLSSTPWIGKIHFFRNTGSESNPVFEEETTSLLDENMGQMLSPEFGDLDGDGDMDLLVGDFNGFIQYFENTGSGSNLTFTFIENVGNIDLSGNSVPTLGDMDGDGDLDLLIGQLNGLLMFYRNEGSKSQFNFQIDTFDDIQVNNNSAPELVDVDGDDDLDLVLGSAGEGVLYFKNLGNSNNFQFQQSSNFEVPIIIGVNTKPAMGQLFDLDTVDIIIGVSTGGVYHIQKERCGLLGDVNDDGGYNVLDIVTLANCVLAGNCADHPNGCAADLNGDGNYNVLDIVTLANCVLAGNCGGRVDDASESRIIIKGNIVSYEAEGFIGGVQMTLTHGADFIIDMTDDALHADYLTIGNETRLLIITPETEELFSFSGEFKIAEVIVANSQYEISVDLPLAVSFSLSKAYPNPFNPIITLNFAIPVDSEVSLSIYNLQGKEVSTLISDNMEAGYHFIIWDAYSYASGVYFVKMVAGEYVNTQKLMLVK